MDYPSSWRHTVLYKLLAGGQHLCSLQRLDLSMTFERGPGPVQPNVNHNVIPLHLSRKTHLQHVQLEIVQPTQRVTEKHSRELVPVFVQYGLDIRAPHLKQLQLDSNLPGQCNCNLPPSSTTSHSTNMPSDITFPTSILSSNAISAILPGNAPPASSPCHGVRLLVWSELPALLEYQVRSFSRSECFDPLACLIGQLGLSSLRKISVEYAALREKYFSLGEVLQQLQKELPQLETVIISRPGKATIPQVTGLNVQVL